MGIAVHVARDLIEPISMPSRGPYELLGRVHDQLLHRRRGPEGHRGAAAGGAGPAAACTRRGGHRMHRRLRNGTIFARTSRRSTSRRWSFTATLTRSCRSRSPGSGQPKPSPAAAWWSSRMPLMASTSATATSSTARWWSSSPADATSSTARWWSSSPRPLTRRVQTLTRSAHGWRCSLLTGSLIRPHQTPRESGTPAVRDRRVTSRRSSPCLT